MSHSFILDDFIDHTSNTLPLNDVMPPPPPPPSMGNTTEAAEPTEAQVEGEEQVLSNHSLRYSVNS